MRLLFIANDFPNPLDPTKGVFNALLARELARQHEIRVIAPIAWTDEWLAKRKGTGTLGADRRVVRDGMEICHPRYYYTPKVLRHQYGWFYWQSIRGTVNRILASFQPDAVLGYWVHPDGESAVRVGRSLGVPAVVMSGGSGVLLLTRNQERRQRIIGVFQGADAVVAVCRDLKEKIVSLGVDSGKVHVVPRGVDCEQFSPGNQEEARRRLGITPDGPMLLWVGRMVPVKGLDVLVEACRLLRDRSEKFHLFLLGGGPLGKEVEFQCRQHGLQECIRLMGSVEHQQLPDWFRAADLTVLPSRSEGIPNVLRESLACGTRFVASRVGGIPEIAEEPRNRLVPPGNAAALADAIAEELRGLKARSECPIPTFTWADSAAELIRVFRTLGVGSVPNRAVNGTAERLLEPVHHGAPSRGRQVIRRLMGTLLPNKMFLVQGPRDCGSVCLTFDDGPDPLNTPRILDILRDRGARASFFVVGQQVERHPELVRRIAAEGHAIGHHTYSHSQPGKTTARQLLEEIQRTRVLLEKILRTNPTLFRPPHGKVTTAKLWGLWKAGMTVVLWNVDPKDYSCRSLDEIRAWFGRRPLRAGDLILMHDKGPHTADFLPELIAQAERRGLTFSVPQGWLKGYRQ